MSKVQLIILLLCSVAITAFSFTVLSNGSRLEAEATEVQAEREQEGQIMDNESYPKILLGGGCFWCIEAALEQLNGIKKVTSGYAGGAEVNPTYDAVCSGRTGHAEVVEVLYDSEVISLPEILEVFFRVHDPITKNRQGADVGTQYRSAIYPSDKESLEIVHTYLAALTEQEVYSSPITTEVLFDPTFYPAEDYHQNYYANNPQASYCQFVVKKKVDIVQQYFSDKLKK